MKSRTVRIALVLAVVSAVAAAVVVWTAPVQVGLATMRTSLQLRGFERKQVESSRGDVVYFEEGHGATLLFLHGLQDQAGGWWQVAPQFSDEYHVVVPDLIGHGDSGPAEGPIHPRDALVQLDALLARAAPDEEVTLVGNSMGGGIALGYALEHPDRVRRLILIDSAGMTMELKDRRFLPKNVDDLRTTLDLVLGPEVPVPPDFILRRMKDRVWEGPTPRLWDQFTSGDAFLDDRLGEIDTPADIVWGTEDGLIPIELGREMHRLLPRSRFHVLEGCGHAPQVDCTDRLNETLRDILAQEPATVTQ